MNYEKFTLKAQEAVRAASALAQTRDNPSVENEHILLALLQQEEGVVPALLDRIGGDKASLVTAAESLVAKLPKSYGARLSSTFRTAPPRLSPRLNRRPRRSRMTLSPRASASGNPWRWKARPPPCSKLRESIRIGFFQPWSRYGAPAGRAIRRPRKNTGFWSAIPGTSPPWQGRINSTL